MIKKILIANRGEIAVRIIRACKELGITAVAVYSDADEKALHVKLADEAYRIGKAEASDSYLNIQRIISLAQEIGADAIHPGYGFLAENAEFIAEVEKSGVKFIGPSAKAVELMGEKTSARRLMKKSGVPIVPGTTEPVKTFEEAKEIAEEIGYPIMLKAAAGGGGKGMRKVESADELKSSFERASNEALKAFGNSDIYIEKFIENPKHIEVQVLADEHGNTIHLFERECSVQRRHQKIIEESPSPSIDDEIRKKITAAAVKAAEAVGYKNAGTVEFLFDSVSKEFYFLEMNTRLQVEHPVTENVTSVDIVKEQIRVASGEKLSYKQEDIVQRGHSIECRIYAEDTENNFAPSTGKILHHKIPMGPGVRVDTGIDLHSEVSVYYDPMLSKLIVWDENRNSAIERMKETLRNYQIAGVTTNIDLLLWVLSHPKFLDASFTINFIEEELLPKLPSEWKEELYKEYEDVAVLLAAILKNERMKFQVLQNNESPFNSWELMKYE